MDRIFIAIAALVGGIVAALVGWLECSDPFNVRKFGSSVVRAVIAGAVFAAGYDLSGHPAAIIDLFYAFLGGAGVDVLGNRISAKLGNGSFPLPGDKKPAQEDASQSPGEGKPPAA